MGGIMTFKRYIVFGCALAAFGCATNVVPVATSGSRSDATVELSYEYGYLQRPVVDEAQAQETALQRCRVWGYSGADPFGGQRSICDLPGEFSCAHTVVTVKYQCTGTGSGQSLPMQPMSAPAEATPVAPTMPVTSQRQCTQQEEAQKRIAIENGYSIIPNCQ